MPWRELTQKINWVGWPHRGQAGQREPAKPGKSVLLALPNWTGLPECNWTRKRLAVGWQNP